ncbi:cytochrome P450 [Thermoflexus hugenholtzii]
MKMKEKTDGRAPPIPSVESRLRALAVRLRGGTWLDALEPLRAGAGDVFRLEVPGFRAVVAAGPASIRAALVEAVPSLRSRVEPDPVVRLFRTGILVMDGAEHAALRRIAAPFFRPAELERFAPAMVRAADRQIEAWADGAQVEIVEAMRTLALEVLLEALFGIPGPTEVPRLLPLLRAAQAYISPGPWLLHPALSRPGLEGPLQELEQTIRDHIRERRAHPMGATLLDAWIEAFGGDEERVRDQMLTMLIAGHDTVAAWLAWTLILLAAHPEVQERARAAVDARLGRGTPSPEALRGLEELEGIGWEALRLYPPIPVLNRRAAAPCTLEGWTIPTGVRVMVSLYTLHRHPGLWAEPHAFRPERFRGEGMGPRFLPFGAGPHTCIGAPLARLEWKLAVARMLQRAAFEPAFSAPRPRMGATLEPAPGLLVRVRRRW